MRFASCVLVAALLMSSAGCGSDNSGGSAPITPDLCISFEPSELPATGNVVARLGADSDCDMATVELVGTDIAGVFAVATHVVYDQEVVRYSGYETDGSVLLQGSANLFVQVGSDAGELTIGVSRNASDEVDIVGTQLLMTLFFVPNDLGAGDMTVATPCLTDGQERPEPLGNVACSGGSFTVSEQAP